ncbi:MAG: hypothetical protein KU37_07445 [Sulfuricurvum sp. PC08-66]|nr:MAG: hypothetical protein KU37_07445 [Sulfuricurvum sp. PC08-66]
MKKILVVLFSVFLLGVSSLGASDINGGTRLSLGVDYSGNNFKPSVNIGFDSFYGDIFFMETEFTMMNPASSNSSANDVFHRTNMAINLLGAKLGIFDIALGVGASHYGASQEYFAQAKADIFLGSLREGAEFFAGVRALHYNQSNFDQYSVLLGMRFE